MARNNNDAEGVKPLHKTRLRDAESTRSSILDAASKCFAEKNYDAVGLREIAAQAGIDVAMIIRYFETKEKLYFQTLHKVSADDDLTTSIENTPLSDLGEVIAGSIFSELSRKRTMIYTRAALSENTSLFFKETIQERFCLSLAKRIKADDAELRADLILSYVLGVATSYYLLELDAISRTDRETIIANVGSAIQWYIDGSVNPASPS